MVLVLILLWEVGDQPLRDVDRLGHRAGPLEQDLLKFLLVELDSVLPQVQFNMKDQQGCLAFVEHAIFIFVAFNNKAQDVLHNPFTQVFLHREEENNCREDLNDDDREVFGYYYTYIDMYIDINISSIACVSNACKKNQHPIHPPAPDRVTGLNIYTCVRPCVFVRIHQ